MIISLLLALHFRNEDEPTLSIISSIVCFVYIIIFGVLIFKSKSKVQYFSGSEYELEYKITTTEYYNCTWSDTTYVIIKRDE